MFLGQWVNNKHMRQMNNNNNNFKPLTIFIYLYKQYGWGAVMCRHIKYCRSAKICKRNMCVGRQTVKEYFSKKLCYAFSPIC